MPKFCAGNPVTDGHIIERRVGGIFAVGQIDFIVHALVLILQRHALHPLGDVVEPIVAAQDRAGERAIDHRLVGVVDVGLVPDRIDVLPSLDDPGAIVVEAIGGIRVLKRHAPAAGGDVDHEKILEVGTAEVSVEADHEIVDFKAVGLVASEHGVGGSAASVSVAEFADALAVIDVSTKLPEQPGIEHEIAVVAGEIEPDVGVISRGDVADIAGHELAVLVGVGLDRLHRVRVVVLLLRFQRLHLGLKLIDLLLKLLVVLRIVAARNAHSADDRCNRESNINSILT